MKTNFYTYGQSLIGIIIVFVMVGLISGGLYYYLSKQIPEVPEIVEKPVEEVVKPEEEIAPPEEELPEEEVAPKEEVIPPKEEAPSEEEKPKVTCQNECSQTGLKRCSNNGYQICGNYDIDICLEWSSITNCPANTICQNGICVQQKCTDGTPYSQCSTNKPKYCDNGNLFDKCSTCGCPLNQYCDESSGLCKISEKLDMLIFVSPQYANDTQIKQAINEYIEAVKNDIGWETKIIAITADINDFREIDEIIEDYYSKSGGRLKASIMVGEDMDTALTADLFSEAFSAAESPSTAPWSTTGGENLTGLYIPGEEDTYTIDLYEGGDLVSSHKQMINIAISLIYPTHSLSYQTKSSQIISVFDKFSENRARLYPRDMRVFVQDQRITEDPKLYEIYQTLKNYGDLLYKEGATQLEINESLTKSYRMYSISGHSMPGYTGLGVDSGFSTDYLNELNTPLFTAAGCYTAGWYTNPNQSMDNNILDFSIDKPWYGSKIFVNPNIRAMILGFPDDPADPGNYNFIMNAVPELNAGKTLAESIINHYYFGNDLILYGDPTFHYNF
jgi:hypothetical protein